MTFGKHNTMQNWSMQGLGVCLLKQLKIAVLAVKAINWKTVAILLPLLISEQILADTLQLEVPQSSINVGEAFQINVIFDGPPTQRYPEPIAALDSSVSIFRGPDVQMTSRNMNGNRSYNTIWTWEARATKPGNFEIPAFRLGGVQSAPLQIKVSGQAQSQFSTGGAGNNANSSVGNDDVMIRYETTKTQALVGEQIILSWKVLFKAKLTGAVEPASLPLNFEKTLLEPDNGKNYVQTIQGEPYEVKEFRQVVFATEPGTYTLDPIVFNGKFRPKRSYGQYQPITLQSNPLTITIKPLDTSSLKGQKGIHNKRTIPVTDALKITTQWGNPKQPVDIGEPITLEIHMSAAGQLSSRLPDIKLKSNSALKIYSDGDESSQNSNWNTGMTGYRTQKFTIIPQKPGSFDIPPMKIAWWSSRTNTMEVTEIPGDTIQVKDGAAAVVQANKQAVSNQASQFGDEDNFSSFNEITHQDDEASENQEDDKATDEASEDKELWQNVAFIFFILWALSMVWGLKYLQRRAKKQEAEFMAAKNADKDKAKGPKIKTIEEQKEEAKAEAKKASRKKTQLDMVPLFEINAHDMSPRENCLLIINKLNLWVEHETGQSPSNITQLIDAIEPKDPWQPLLQECELFLYGNGQSWPRAEMKQQLVKGLPKLDMEDPSDKSNNDDDDDILPAFTPK
ncbi:MAG TPA: hypothetical protein DDW29_17785 [Gammaproteobacteria bacterium]|nr:hypothetical protein [Gammaproteobacteria bacterium]|tara:strand:+ start:2134 stop:4170 length:2037 start_codon:yes stop_codon:yes gene_type:complete